MKLNSRRKLRPTDADRFANAEPALFRELARVVCATGMLPQKELHECWQMANVVHTAFPEVLHVADMAAGHGLLAWILVLLARSDPSPIPRTAVALDINRPKSADALATAMIERWPNLADSVHYVEGSIDAVTANDGPRTLLVAAHACGSLSDRVLLAAITSRSPVAIMPCCHSLRKQAATLKSLALVSGMPAPAAGPCASIDQFRIEALAALGYHISEDSIERDITPFNRIIIGQPPRASHPKAAGYQLAGAPDRVKRLGEVRAFEKVPSFNVADLEEARALSRRPSREWFRSFDLSYWVDDEATGHRVAAALEGLTPRFLLSEESVEEALRGYLSGPSASLDPVHASMEATITIRDRYLQPTTQRLAFTYRIAISSSTVAITRDAACLLRNQLCQALKILAQRLQANFVGRGE